MKKLSEVKVGDTVHRYLAGEMHMPLEVTEVTDDHIICGCLAYAKAKGLSVPERLQGSTDAWVFCRKTGAEIDEELGWGPQFGASGSFILTEPMEKEKQWKQ